MWLTLILDCTDSTSASDQMKERGTRGVGEGAPAVRHVLHYTDTCCLRETPL